MTSHDVVNIVRRVDGYKKSRPYRHSGSDGYGRPCPYASDAAARITEYLDLDFKTYRCDDACLVKTTDTQDIWGQIIEETASRAGRPKKSVREAFVRVQRPDRAGSRLCTAQ